MNRVCCNAEMKKRRGSPARRRGGMYVTVLGASMFVTMIGLAALTAVRIQGRSSAGENDTTTARIAARSAIEYAMDKVAAYDDWRTREGGPFWQHSFDFAGGTATVLATDPSDDDLGDSLTDSVVLQGIGEVGGSRQILQVSLQAQINPLEILNTCFHANGDVQIKTNTVTMTGAPLSTNGNARIDSVLAGDLHAATRSGGGTVTGNSTVPAAAKAGPADSVMADYQAIASAIIGISDIESVVLSPDSNKWGPKNADGVYKLSSSSNVRIRDMRLLGTLIISAPGMNVTIEREVLLQPFRADYPTLIVQAANLSFNFNPAVSLSEAGIGVNFNPTGTPYAGTTDSDQADVYPNEVHGLVHVIGNVTVDQPCVVRGVVFCTGTMVADKAAQFIHDSSLYLNPPIGYTAPPTMIIAQQSWQQAVDP